MWLGLQFSLSLSLATLPLTYLSLIFSFSSNPLFLYSIDALIKAIHEDIDAAVRALDSPENSPFAQNPHFSPTPAQ